MKKKPDKDQPREIRTHKHRIITVKPEAIIHMKDLPPEERKKQLIKLPSGETRFAKGVKIGFHNNPKDVLSSRRVKSILDQELEKFLMKEILIGKGKRKVQSSRMQMFLKAVFVQACKGVGKGRMAELIFERVGGKPTQEIFSDQMTAAIYDDPDLRRQRIKELRRTLKQKIST